MAILEDASSPARVIGSGATLVTAAFTPPSNCILAAFMFGDANNSSLDETLTPTDSASGTWSTPILDNARGGAAAAVAYRIIGTSPGSMTVTLTDNKGSVAKGLNVRVLTGTDLVNPVGATATAGTASISVVSTVANSWVWSAYLGSNATVTAGANTTLQDEFGGFDSGDAVATFNSTNVTASAGTTITLVEVGGTAVHHVAVEFVPPNTASIPFNPQRSVQSRDPGETWWIQRDRRDANLVAGAVNALPSPLDVSAGAGGRLWHMYGDAADAAPRTWQSLQRTATDPSLLNPTVTAVPYNPGRPVAVRDAGEVPWSQQRRVSDPLLLTSALLENELLGGAGTGPRGNVPATHAPRVWAPQQPARVATTPGLLDQAELEGALLGGAETGKRNLPATHTDRREIPTQRPYISDPSFYPTGTATDPLTVAWGAGGTYWQMYNLAAVDVDRRESPQQRRYISDLALLATALLENELLGGDGRHGTWYARPAVAAFPRPARSAPDVLADPLQLTADLVRRILTPVTHADRRQAGQQLRRLIDQAAPSPAVQRATSTSTVTARRTSTDAVAARRTSTDAVSARRTSTPDVEG